MLLSLLVLALLYAHATALDQVVSRMRFTVATLIEISMMSATDVATYNKEIKILLYGLSYELQCNFFNFANAHHICAGSTFYAAC